MNNETDLKIYFLQKIKLLNKLEQFKDLLITGKIMKESKKESYWSTVYFVGMSKKRRKLGYATIYINLRDIDTQEKILEAIAQEASHLVKLDKEVIKSFIKN